MQITRNVHALKIPFRLTAAPGLSIDRFVYVYLIYGTEICLIDSGVASSEEVIFDYVRKTGRKISDISLIVQTHSHPDHIGATRTIKAETGCSVAVHPAEKAWIEDVKLQAAERPVPGFDQLVAGQVAIDRTLGEGDIIDLGCGLKLHVLETPGHSKGSISLLLPGHNILFTGDAVPVAGEVPVYEDVLASVRSVKRLQAIPGLRYLLASWDEPRKGEQAYRKMAEGLQYLQRVHEAVLSISVSDPSADPMKFCRRVFEELGIPAAAANPLAARSLASHSVLAGRKNILEER